MHKYSIRVFENSFNWASTLPNSNLSSNWQRCSINFSYKKFCPQPSMSWKDKVRITYPSHESFKCSRDFNTHSEVVMWNVTAYLNHIGNWLTFPRTPGRSRINGDDNDDDDSNRDSHPWLFIIIGFQKLFSNLSVYLPVRFSQQLVNTIQLSVPSERSRKLRYSEIKCLSPSQLAPQNLGRHRVLFTCTPFCLSKWKGSTSWIDLIFVLGSSVVNQMPVLLEIYVMTKTLNINFSTACWGNQ